MIGSNVLQQNVWFRAGRAVRTTVARHPYLLIVAALAIGIGIGRSPIFGYANAEECAVQAQTKWSVGACYDLYPSIHAR